MELMRGLKTPLWKFFEQGIIDKKAEHLSNGDAWCTF